MKKALQSTLLLFFISMNIFAQKHSYELKPEHTLSVKKVYNSVPTVYRLTIKDVEVSKYDSVNKINDEYSKLLTSIETMEQNLELNQKEYLEKVSDFNVKQSIISNIQSFKTENGSFKKRKLFLIEAQKLSDSLKLGYLIHPKKSTSFSEKLEYKSLRIEGKLDMYLSKIEGDIARYNRKPSRPYSPDAEAKINQLKKLLEKTPKQVKTLILSNDKTSKKALVLETEVKDIATLSGVFYYTNKDYVILTQDYKNYVQGEVIDSKDISNELLKHTVQRGTIITNRDTNEQYMAYPRLLTDYGIDMAIVDTENSLKKMGYKTSYIKGLLYFDTPKSRLMLTPDIYENLNTTYINQLSNSVSVFESSIPKSKTLVTKLANHFSSYTKGTMTKARLETWKKDCKAAITLQDKIDNLKGRDMDNLYNFQKHINIGSIEAYTEFEQVLNGSRRVLGI